MTAAGAAESERRAAALAELNAEVVACTRCPRLVWWREESARLRPRRYAGEEYWARPVPGFGDPAARILIVGLAPAAHGGNRTGRVFTGDRSGDFLFPALHAAGLANQPTSERPGDGLRLIGAYIAAVNRCAPPANRPTPAERDNCLPYLVREMRLLTDLRVLVCLGAFAWDGALRALAALGHGRRPQPRFGHGTEARVGPYLLVGTFHPSQQNTFTRRLTPSMLEAVMRRADAAAREHRAAADEPPAAPDEPPAAPDEPPAAPDEPPAAPDAVPFERAQPAAVKPERGPREGADNGPAKRASSGT